MSNEKLFFDRSTSSAGMDTNNLHSFRSLKHFLPENMLNDVEAFLIVLPKTVGLYYSSMQDD